MKFLRTACIALAVAVAFQTAGSAVPVTTVTDADVYATIGPDGVTLGNGVVERHWDPASFVTTSLRDKRPGGVAITARQADFALLLDVIRVGSDQMSITNTEAAILPRGGVGVTFTLSLFGLATITRTVEAYPGVAGFGSRTAVTPLVPLVVSGYTLDEVAVGTQAVPTVHAFRAGSDWREPEWKPQGIGDKHTGDWHVSASAAEGQALTAAGEWLSLAQASRTTFMVMERMDYSSSRMSYDGNIASALVDLSRDIAYLGPFEESIHVENPTPGPARHRVLLPTTTTVLERVFTGFGATADDEPWQFYKYLSGHRLAPYQKTVMFNSDGVDSNQVSTGSKDDVNFARFQPLAAAAREMGVETFILDDGWQARSGDWCPDSAACPEPRAPRFPDRFPDDTFAAVRSVLAGEPGPADDMKLGLWMSPMEFHPSSAAFTTNPQWACLPVGLGTAALSIVQPDDGSNEPGIGVWNPEAIGRDPDSGEVLKLIDYIEGRIRRAITSYGARYFKFDFLVWEDCLGVAPVDMYGYHDSFVAMLDRLQKDHPEVTFQIDDTNDYRLFPFETIARGPAWFQNGAPQTPQLLHNLWNLAPYVPGFAIGQKSLTNIADVTARGIDYSMAVALGSHMTFMTEIDKRYTSVQRAQVKRWTDFYKANRDDLATFTYPLLTEPLNKSWTALQPWNADTGSGFLLAFRQEAANATQKIALRGVPASGSFTLTLEDPATGSSTSLGVFDANALRTGVDITIPNPYGYAIVRITPS